MYRRKAWPGVPVTPIMLVGATDGRHRLAHPYVWHERMFAIPGEANARPEREDPREVAL